MKVVIICNDIKTSEELQKGLIGLGVKELDVELFPETKEELKEAFDFFDKSDDLLDENGIDLSAVICSKKGV